MDRAQFAALSDLPSGIDGLVGFRGDVAKFRSAQYQRAKMMGLGPLWKHSNEFVDDAVNRIGREGLVIAADRMELAGVNMPEWLAIPELTSHKVGESRAAQRGMVPGARGEGGLQDKTPYTVPIYVTWDSFSFNVRELAAAERVGRPLDTDEIEQAVRNVNYAIEDAIISGAMVVGGNSTPGFDATTNIQQFGDSGRVWDHASKTGANIIDDVLAMRAVLAADKFYGPYTLYVSTTYGARLQKKYDDANGTLDMTVQQALEALTFGNSNLKVKTADLLTEDVVYLAQDTAGVCDVIIGQQPTAIMPMPEGEWTKNWTVFACIVPRVKSDHSSNFGICEGNTSGS